MDDYRPDMAHVVAARYAEGNARSAPWLDARPAYRDALFAMQAAYVAWCRAYARRYPAERHLLPTAHKSEGMLEMKAFYDAMVTCDKARYQLG